MSPIENFVFQKINAWLPPKGGYSVVHPLTEPFRFSTFTREAFNADVRRLQLVFAIWTWRADHGAWPENLLTLIPEYLSTDFSHGEESDWIWMHQECTETPYLIWSGIRDYPHPTSGLRGQKAIHWILGHAVEPHFTPELIELLKATPKAPGQAG